MNNNKEKKKQIVYGIFWLFAVAVVLYSAYINLFLEPLCEYKGYANVDNDGCYYYKNRERIYEQQYGNANNM